MRSRRFSFAFRAILALGSALVAAGIALRPATSRASSPPGPAELPSRPRVVLALSGGGARGFAHVGVLRGLERCGIPIDGIAGTSSGALLGGLYAIGYTPDELEQVALGQHRERISPRARPAAELPLTRESREDWPLVTLELDDTGLRIPGALAGSRRTDERLSLLVLRGSGSTGFDALTIPFVAIAADLETGRKAVLGSGSLVSALRASSAVPGVYPPVERDGRMLIDGGILDNLPVEEARALGADLVIAVDISSPLHHRRSLRSFVDVIDQAVGFRMIDQVAEARAGADVVIAPEVGSRGTFEFSPEAARDVIVCGEEAALAACPAIRERLRLAGGSSPVPEAARPQRPHIHSIRVESLAVRGARARAENLIRRHFGALPGDRYLELRDLELRLERLRGLVELKRVDIDYASEDARLTLDVTEAPPLAVRVAARVDSKYDALGRVAVSWRPGLQPLSDVSADLVFGTTIRLLVGARRERLFGSPLKLFGRVLSLEDFDRVAGPGAASGELRTLRQGFEGGLAWNFGMRHLLSFGYRREDASSRVSLGVDPSLAEDLDIGALVARVELDSSDRSEFPHEGTALSFHGILARPDLGGDADYTLVDGQARAWLPLGRRTTAYLRGRLADSLTGSVPELERLVVGGNDPLPGYAQDAFRGEELALGTLGLRHQILKLPAGLRGGIYLSIEAAGGTVSGGREEFSDHGRLLYGAALRASAATRLGPFDLSFGVNRDGDTRITFEAGPRF